MKWLLKYLERAGRCKALMDAFGDVFFVRYYLLGVEPDEAYVDAGKVKARWLPNIWLHHIPQTDHGPDGGNYHTHPWSNLTVVLSGGYMEHTESGAVWRGAGSIVRRDVTEPHYIGKTAPKTYSLFFHWFRRSDWGFQPKVCKNLCGECEPKGRCDIQDIHLKHNEYMSAFGEKNAPSWVIYNDAGKVRINRRQRAAARVGLSSLNEKDLEKYVQTKSRLALIGVSDGN